MSRPSPQVGSPSGVNQSTRTMPVALPVGQVHVADVLQPRLSGLARLATWPRGRALIGAGEEQELLDIVRGDVGEDAAIAARGRRTSGPRFVVRSRCGPRPTVWTTSPMAPAATSSPALTVARLSKCSE